MIAAITDAFLALKHRNVWVLSLTLGFILATYEMWYPVLPVHLKNLGANDKQVGDAYAIFAFSYALFQFLGGILADKFGRKNLIIFPMFFTAPLYLIASQVTNWKIFVSLLVLSNLLSAFQWPSFIALLAESVEERLQGSAFAIFEIAIALGIAIGTFTGSIIYKHFGVSNLIMVSAIATLLGATIRVFGLRETMKRSKTMNAGRLAVLIRKFNPSLRWCFAGMVGFAILSSITLNGPFITLHAKFQVGLTEQEVFRIFLIAGVSAIITAPFSGWLTDKIGSKIMFMIGALGHGFFIIPWMLSSNYWAGVPFVFAAATCLQTGAIAKNSLISQLTPAAYRTSFIGFAGTLAGLIASIGPLIGTRLKENFGHHSPFIFAFIIGVCTFIVLIPIKQITPKESYYKNS